MKNQFLIMASCALLLLSAGCKGKNTPESFHSDVACPEWTAIEVPDMTSSMTAVVKVDLKAQYPDLAADFVLDDNDLLAAFSGELCLGVATPRDGLFYLFVVGLNTDPITLRYWSACFKNLFEAKDAFVFHNDDHLGTVAEPFSPTFVVVK